MLIDNLKQDEVIAILLQNSLLQMHETKNNYKIKYLPADILADLNTVFTMHELTQFAVQDLLNEVEYKSSIKEAINVLATFLPNKHDLFLPLVDRANFLLSHLKVVIGHAEIDEIRNNDLITLYIRQLEYYLSGKRDFVKTEQVIEKIEKALPTIPSSNPILCRLHLMKALFFAAKYQDYKRGIEETEQAITILNKLESNNEEEYLMAYTRLGTAPCNSDQKVGPAVDSKIFNTTSFYQTNCW